MPIVSEKSTQEPRDLRPLGLVSIAVAMVAATWVAAGTWKDVRVRPEVRTIEVTGSAKKRITSDLIQWSATVEVTGSDRSQAYRVLHDHVAKAQAFLTGAGVKATDLRISSVSVEPQYVTEYEGKGEDRIERQRLTGYETKQSLVISSTDVALIERMSREITGLLEQGVTISSAAPAYFYTKLGEVKIEMLAEASKDARTRADKIVGSAGGARIGRLRSADMGVINVNPANATATSWEGNNDTSSVDKDILTIVHATFELE